MFCFLLEYFLWTFLSFSLSVFLSLVLSLTCSLTLSQILLRWRESRKRAELWNYSLWITYSAVDFTVLLRTRYFHLFSSKTDGLSISLRGGQTSQIPFRSTPTKRVIFPQWKQEANLCMLNNTMDKITFHLIYKSQTGKFWNDIGFPLLDTLLCALTFTDDSPFSFDLV